MNAHNKGIVSGLLKLLSNKYNLQSKLVLSANCTHNDALSNQSKVNRRLMGFISACSCQYVCLHPTVALLNSYKVLPKFKSWNGFLYPTYSIYCLVNYHGEYQYLGFCPELCWLWDFKYEKQITFNVLHKLNRKHQ